jgi:hypothetical protein
VDGHATKARGVLGLGGGGDEVCSDLNVCGELKWKDWIGWGGFLWMSECVRECGRECLGVVEGEEEEEGEEEGGHDGRGREGGRMISE